MLKNTYIHIPGVGKALEQKIWASGINTWDEFLEMEDSISIPSLRKTRICDEIKISSKHLDERDCFFFSQRLPSAEHWRTYSLFSDSVAFFDIETTGLSPSRDRITVVGIYDGNESKMYVRGINLGDIVEEFSKYKLLVSFNGARFDIPFIKSEFPEIEFKQLHIDLMYPLRRIGYSGGLKNIEKLLGICRSEDTDGMDGFDAVRLWRHYEKGDREALDLLLKYNREDIVNLKTIIELTYPKMIEKALNM
ncbi:MAG: ribonuclease H-like domain-containing protein [Methanosarcina sp.]|uniref:ribonuclease H-like domain-containing protein n=1 Tax=Methanosarcina sp. TaxID=2213 RepID=UPI00260AB0AA|nr:ribonuclease H-like domain-containing protein [Methanosarcina sp.]MDD3247012.1 ribonuclease H-like domain-containing protein [Methanosarcina sp.]MDD4249008.1 ribonuclease H-like domain-containing protein [Methanosarcina sp.]